MSTYDFSTQKGSSEQVSLPAPSDAGSLTVEFAATRHFETISLTKTVTASGGNVFLSLSSAEVDALKDCRYRVSAGGQVFIEGSVAYVVPNDTTPVTKAELDAALAGAGGGAVSAQAAYVVPVAIQNSAEIADGDVPTSANFNAVVQDVGDLIATLQGLIASLSGDGKPMAAAPVLPPDGGGGRF